MKPTTIQGHVTVDSVGNDPLDTRKPPAPVELATVRCWSCRRIIGEWEPEHWARIKCAACNAWNVVQAGLA
jgi:hypothetical protein